MAKITDLTQEQLMELMKRGVEANIAATGRAGQNLRNGVRDDMAHQTEVILAGTGRAAQNLRDGIRDDMARQAEAILAGTGRAGKKVCDHVTADGDATRSHIDRRTDDIIDACGRDRMAPWMVIVGALVGVLFAVASGFLCWDIINQYLCWTMDTAGNVVQVANYATAVKYAYLLDGIIAVAVGALAAWATSTICSCLGNRR